MKGPRLGLAVLLRLLLRGRDLVDRRRACRGSSDLRTDLADERARLLELRHVDLRDPADLPVLIDRTVGIVESELRLQAVFLPVLEALDAVPPREGAVPNGRELLALGGGQVSPIKLVA